MNKILDDVRTPPRSPSPNSLYRTEEEIFELQNPGYNYDFVAIRELESLWNKVGTIFVQTMENFL